LDKRGNSALAYAIKNDREDIVLYFLATYADKLDLAAVNADGDTLFIMAAQTGSIDILKELHSTFNQQQHRFGGITREQVMRIKGFRQLTAFEIVEEEWGDEQGDKAEALSFVQ
jgi:ankyrin repeat protein